MLRMLLVTVRGACRCGARGPHRHKGRGAASHGRSARRALSEDDEKARRSPLEDAFPGRAGWACAHCSCPGAAAHGSGIGLPSPQGPSGSCRARRAESNADPGAAGGQKIVSSRVGAGA